MATRGSPCFVFVFVFVFAFVFVFLPSCCRRPSLDHAHLAPNVPTVRDVDCSGSEHPP